MSTISTVGGLVITADGRNALSRAASGQRIVPKTYRVSADDITLDPTMTDLDGWRTAEISGVKLISDDAVEFTIDIDPTAAHDYLRSAALFLEDGTLFAIAKPSYPMPPGLRQTLKMQVEFSELSELMTLEYLPHQEEEQDLRTNNTAAVLGNIFLKVSQSVRALGERVDALWKAHRSDQAQTVAALEKKVERSDFDASRAESLNATAVLGNMILDMSQKTRTIQTT